MTYPKTITGKLGNNHNNVKPSRTKISCEIMRHARTGPSRAEEFGLPPTLTRRQDGYIYLHPALAARRHDYNDLLQTPASRLAHSERSDRGTKQNGRGPAKHNVIGDLISEGQDGTLCCLSLHRNLFMLARPSQSVHVYT